MERELNKNSVSLLIIFWLQTFLLTQIPLFFSIKKVNIWGSCVNFTGQEAIIWWTAALPSFTPEIKQIPRNHGQTSKPLFWSSSFAYHFNHLDNTEPKITNLTYIIIYLSFNSQTQIYRNTFKNWKPQWVRK